MLADLAAPGGGRAYRASGRIYLHVYAEETAPPDAVAASLEQLLAVTSEMRGDLRRAYFAQAAYWQAATRRNAALAHAWLADARAVKNVVDQKDWDAASLAAVAAIERKPVTNEGGDNLASGQIAKLSIVDAHGIRQ